jgi:hypothetical protein
VKQEPRPHSYHQSFVRYSGFDNQFTDAAVQHARPKRSSDRTESSKTGYEKERVFVFKPAWNQASTQGRPYESRHSEKTISRDAKSTEAKEAADKSTPVCRTPPPLVPLCLFLFWC